METLALRARVPTQFLVSPKLPRVFRNTENVFYFLNINTENVLYFFYNIASTFWAIRVLNLERREIFRVDIELYQHGS